MVVEGGTNSKKIVEMIKQYFKVKRFLRKFGITRKNNK